MFAYRPHDLTMDRKLTACLAKALYLLLIGKRSGRAANTVPRHLLESLQRTVDKEGLGGTS